MVFITGLFLLLILLEVSLRVVGSIYAYLAEPEIVTKSESHTTILSVGDSVTFGLGAEREFSYPAQLEGLLNESTASGLFRVINRGVPGQNSAKLLLNLERQLKQIQPDIVTVLIGAQNQVNYFGYRDFLKQSNRGHLDIKLDIHDRLDRFKIYKFTRLLFIESFKAVQWVSRPRPEGLKAPPKKEGTYGGNNPGAQSQPNSAADCSSAKQLNRQGKYDQVLKLVRRLDEAKHAESTCYFLAGNIYRERMQYDRAIGWFEKGVTSDPEDFQNYDGLAQSYIEQFHLDKAMYWWQQGFENARSSSLRPNSYVSIGEAFKITHNIPGAIKFFEQEVKRRRFTNDDLYSRARETLMVLKNRSIDQEIYRWIEADIRKVVDLCQKFNALVVLQGYPYEPKIESIYKKVAADRGIPLVEHLPSFQPFVTKSGYSQEYFVPDGHPNGKGYGLMAQNIKKVLLEKVIQ